MRFQQILITRYNVESSAAAEAGIDPFLAGWIAHRDLLFRRYCAASVRNQTHRDFDWFIMFHPETPRKYFDFLEGTGIPIFARTHREGIGIIQRKHIRSDTIVASRMDNDDAIASHFMHRVKMIVEGALQDGFGGGRPFLVSFRNGIVAHSPSGAWRSRSQPSAPFVTLVEHLAAGESWISPLAMDHNDAPNMFPMISVDNKEPAWALVVHDRNISNHVLWEPSAISEGKLRSFPQSFPSYRSNAATPIFFPRVASRRGLRVVRWGFRQVRSLVLGPRSAPGGWAANGELAADPQRSDYRQITSRLSPAIDRMKLLIARHVILKNRFLLRFCQGLGKFKKSR
jgi:hypothetical protein